MMLIMEEPFSRLIHTVYVCVYCAQQPSCVIGCVFEEKKTKTKHAHLLNVELHVLLGTALDLLLHFSHHRLHVNNAFLGDASEDS